jgi:aubergine-like protein
MEQVKSALGSFYTKEGKPMPKFTFIVVTKKINTRLFTAGAKPDNPPPGTVLDDVVTLPER